MVNRKIKSTKWKRSFSKAPSSTALAAASTNKKKSTKTRPLTRVGTAQQPRLQSLSNKNQKKAKENRKKPSKKNQRHSKKDNDFEFFLEKQCCFVLQDVVVVVVVSFAHITTKVVVLFFCFLSILWEMFIPCECAFLKKFLKYEKIIKKTKFFFYFFFLHLSFLSSPLNNNVLSM